MPPSISILQAINIIQLPLLQQPIRRHSDLIPPLHLDPIIGGTQINSYDLITNITIYSIQNFSDDVKCIITDMFLWQLWNLKVKNNDSNKPLYIFIDEFQNMNFHANSPLYKILCEGRKYGLNLILGTQFVKGRYDKMQLAAFGQVGTKIYFRPNDDELSSVAKDIDPSLPKKWVPTLQHLQKGYAVIKSTCCFLMILKNTTHYH